MIIDTTKDHTAFDCAKVFAQAFGMMFGCLAIMMILALIFVPYLIRDTARALSGHVTALVLLGALLSASTVHAQDSVDLSEERLSRLNEGQRAPFSGILAPESLFVDWRTRIVLLEEQLEINDEAASSREAALDELYQARLVFEGERRVLERGLFEQRIETLASELAKAREANKRGFFEQPAFWFAMGVIVTGVGVALVAVAAQ